MRFATWSLLVTARCDLRLLNRTRPQDVAFRRETRETVPVQKTNYRERETIAELAFASGSGRDCLALRASDREPHGAFHLLSDCDHPRGWLDWPGHRRAGGPRRRSARRIVERDVRKCCGADHRG